MTPRRRNGRAGSRWSGRGGWASGATVAVAVVTVVTVVAVAVLGLAGCDGSRPPSTPASAASASGAGPAAPSLSPGATLRRAANRFDAAASFSFTVASTDLPTGVTALVAADGVAARPDRVKGSFTARQGASQRSVHIVSVGGTLWIQVPLIGTWVKADPDQLGVADPATLLSRRHGVSAILRAVHARSSVPRPGGGVHVRGTLPGSVLTTLLRWAGDTALRTTVDTDSAGRLIRLRLQGVQLAAYTSASSYTFAFAGYDTPVTIKAP